MGIAALRIEDRCCRGDANRGQRFHERAGGDQALTRRSLEFASRGSDERLRLYHRPARRHDCRIARAVTRTGAYRAAAEFPMSAPVSGPIAIGALDLAALLCSRVCHDLISPVGAIVNGLEVLEEDKDEETKTFALDLIKKSAHQASAKLQFCRLAFGAAGSAGAQIDLGDAEKAARGLSRTARPPWSGICRANCWRKTASSSC